MKIVFAGTPALSAFFLQCLLQKNYNIAGVITQKDKPRGRGLKVAFSPVKELALKSGLVVFQPDKLDDELMGEIKKIEPDLIVVVAYGKILPKSFLDIPRYGCINVHFSLLPKYRGAAPVQWTIIQGEKTTGVTVAYITEELDAGDIILQEEIGISDRDNAGTLFDKLIPIGQKLLLNAIEMIMSGNVKRFPQEGEVSYAPPIKKEMTKIDWNIPAYKINYLIRALNPSPVAWTYFRGKIFKIWSAEVIDDNNTYSEGKIVYVQKNEIRIGTKSGILSPLEVQLEGGRKMQIAEFISGYRPKIGEVFS